MLSFVAALTGCGADFVPSYEIPEPSVRIVTPEHGSRVPSPVLVNMMVENFVLEPPGEARAFAGYLVLILYNGCLEEGAKVPFDDRYIHLDDGSTQLKLPSQNEAVRLCLQAADGDRRALPYTHEIEFESYLP